MHIFCVIDRRQEQLGANIYIMEKDSNIPTTSICRADERKMIERNRRNQMKTLYSHLYSLLPHHQSSTDTELVAPSVVDQLGQATSYIKHVEAKVQRLKERKERLMLHPQESLMMGSMNGVSISTATTTNNNNTSSRTASTSCAAAAGESKLLMLARVEIQEMGKGDLRVLLNTGSSLDHQVLFTETIRILHEGGAEILNANFSVVDDTVFHTIHSQVGEADMGNGTAAMISERLKKLVQEYAPN